jgi:ribosomal-protein-alanine N-acetyltransferase
MKPKTAGGGLVIPSESEGSASLANLLLTMMATKVRLAKGDHVSGLFQAEVCLSPGGGYDSIARFGTPLELVQIRIRAFQPEDFESAYRLDQSCYPPGIAYSRYALREFLSLPGARAWVAEEEGKLLGFVVVRSMGRGRGHVITLDVKENRRRQRTGAKLLATAEDWLAGQGVRRVRLETAVNNQPAVAFWQKSGYQVSGRIPRYYLDRDDAFRMEKEIP